MKSPHCRSHAIVVTHARQGWSVAVLPEFAREAEERNKPSPAYDGPFASQDRLTASSTYPLRHALHRRPEAQQSDNASSFLDAE